MKTKLGLLAVTSLVVVLIWKFSMSKEESSLSENNSDVHQAERLNPLQVPPPTDNAPESAAVSASETPTASAAASAGSLAQPGAIDKSVIRDQDADSPDSQSRPAQPTASTQLSPRAQSVAGSLAMAAMPLRRGPDGSYAATVTIRIEPTCGSGDWDLMNADFDLNPDLQFFVSLEIPASHEVVWQQQINIGDESGKKTFELTVPASLDNSLLQLWVCSSLTREQKMCGKHQLTPPNQILQEQQVVRMLRSEGRVVPEKMTAGRSYFFHPVLLVDGSLAAWKDADLTEAKMAAIPGKLQATIPELFDQSGGEPFREAGRNAETIQSLSLGIDPVSATLTLTLPQRQTAGCSQ